MGWRPRRCPVRVPGRRHEAGAVLHGLALRAALVHRRPGPCNARDALGAHGSRRELSRVHSRHTARSALSQLVYVSGTTYLRSLWIRSLLRPTAGHVMLTSTFYRAFCSCKCRIRPCICPLHACGGYRE